jgi:hypothetical protein
VRQPPRHQPPPNPHPPPPGGPGQAAPAHPLSPHAARPPRPHLVLLADAHGVHARVPAAAQHVAQRLEALDGVRCEAHLTAAGDALAALHKRRHGRALAGAQEAAVARAAARHGGAAGGGGQLGPDLRRGRGRGPLRATQARLWGLVMGGSRGGTCPPPAARGLRRAHGAAGRRRCSAQARRRAGAQARRRAARRPTTASLSSASSLALSAASSVARWWASQEVNSCASCSSACCSSRMLEGCSGAGGPAGAREGGGGMAPRLSGDLRVGAAAGGRLLWGALWEAAAGRRAKRGGGEGGEGEVQAMPRPQPAPRVRGSRAAHLSAAPFCWFPLPLAAAAGRLGPGAGLGERERGGGLGVLVHRLQLLRFHSLRRFWRRLRGGGGRVGAARRGLAARRRAAGTGRHGGTARKPHLIAGPGPTHKSEKSVASMPSSLTSSASFLPAVRPYCCGSFWYCRGGSSLRVVEQQHSQEGRMQPASVTP